MFVIYVVIFLTEEPSSIKVKLESYEVQADSVPSPQLEEVGESTQEQTENI